MSDCFNSENPTPLHGVVLAGGKSKRLGHDKGKVVFQGQDLVVRAVKVLEASCVKVWISGRDAAGHGLDTPWFLDRAPGKGPLSGILTALEKIQAPCMFLPCDLPLMTRDVTKQLVTAYAKRPQGTLRVDFRQEETGFIEALVGIYEPACIPFIKEALEQQRFKVALSVPDDRCVHVPYSVKTASRPFLNINYPEDLKLLTQAGDNAFCLLPSSKKKPCAYGIATP